MKRSCLHMYPDRDLLVFQERCILRELMIEGLFTFRIQAFTILLDKKMPSHAIPFYFRACLRLKFLVVEAG